MYETLTQSLLPKLRDKYSTSMIAYGQTGSGKTHTIFGPPGCLKPDAVNDWGLMPRLMSDLLETPGVTLAASAVEVYQDLAYDLLSESSPLTVGTKGRGQLTDPNNKKVAVAGQIVSSLGAVGEAHPAGCTCCYCERAKIKKMEDFRRKMAERRGETYFGPGVDPFKAKPPRGAAARSPHASKPYAAKAAAAVDYATVGEKVASLRSVEDILSLCRTVELSRASASHELNERSSRSHCLVTLHCAVTAGGKSTRTTCVLVDLAGSERIERTKVKGVAKQQAIEINKSLTALGRVVKSLAAKGKGKHVPYRDSTLTMLLRDSFGGNARTTVVVCVAGSATHDEETLRSLQFGGRLGGVRSQNVERSRSFAGAEVQGAATMLRVRLEAARSDLAGLDGGGVDPTAANPAAVRKFKEDIRRLEGLRGKVRAAEEAGYIGGGKGEGKELAELRDQARRLKEDIESRKWAVDRLTQRRIWKEPSQAWLKKDKEVRELEGRLTMGG